MSKRLNIGVIGYGYWGPNIARNFKKHANCIVRVISDINRKALHQAKKDFPGVILCNNWETIIRDQTIDVVCVITPLSTHYKIAKAALIHGKHVLVEKPFTSTSEEAEELVSIAARKKRVLMVDHTFLFTGPVLKIKALIDQGELGKIIYIDSTRVNLGLFQTDINVIWDLASHDFAILDYLIKECPSAVSVIGKDHFNRGLEDLAYVNVFYKSGLTAHLSLNWLSPVKIRSTVIGGTKKMVIWNDLEATEKIKVYDKGIRVIKSSIPHKLIVDYRIGDVWAPKVELTEALEAEADYFVRCVLNHEIPLNDGRQGLRIVKLLEAANQSLKYKGKLIKV